MVVFTKKAVTEITSFVLITLLVVISSSLAYYFSKDMLDEKTYERDLVAMEQFFKSYDRSLSSSFFYNNSQMVHMVKFSFGQLIFEGSFIKYQSLVTSKGIGDYCEGVICYNSTGEFEVISLNVSPYVFSETISLIDGSYVLSSRYSNGATKQINLQLQ